MPVLRQFLTGFVDYAGLFPPAELDMPEAVRSYAEYREGDDHQLLGRFVVPASRLGEFSEAGARHLDRGDKSVPWCLSVLVDGDATFARKAMLEFTASHMQDSPLGHALCDAVEVRAMDDIQIMTLAKSFSSPIRIFFEVASDERMERNLELVARNQGAAKIRMGGTSADAFPSAASVVKFIATCNRLQIPFKATAGLHHAICGSYPLTYEANSGRGRMFGFLNLFLAAAFTRKGLSEIEAQRILEENNAAEFVFRESGVTWRGHHLTRDDLRMSRSHLFLSFGSCSFREPVDEARALGLI
ncbi:MAG TPA: hypothetical protein VM099_12650 [Gemmatimonadaceae bacterium]|nr:hypothetical protein [Gemmatimonadaceae bacterium]